jgi:hypothetical protein
VVVPSRDRRHFRPCRRTLRSAAAGDSVLEATVRQRASPTAAPCQTVASAGR